MSYATRHLVSLTTDGDGAATGYTPEVTGVVRSISYVKTDFADGVDFTITSDITLQTIWTESNVNAAKTVCPKQATHTTVGVAALYAGGGSAVLADVVVANERIKIVIAAGGDTKTGAFHVVMG
jgi:hypothetical protein